MNREIKFRAWHKPTKTMQNVFQIHFDYQEVMFIDDDVIFEKPPEPYFSEFSECEIMQYTGLKDKNGKEIYEGDVVCLNDVVCPITWLDGGFQMITLDNQGKSAAVQERLNRFVVIGNIHENPELLK